ncbi:hypothetical protein, partial [Sutterella wadsworthensis]
TVDFHHTITRALPGAPKKHPFERREVTLERVLGAEAYAGLGLNAACVKPWRGACRRDGRR